MVLPMKTRWLLVALLSTALAFASACGGGGDESPFEGNWIAATGERITFTSDTWQDSDGDAGTYSFTGEDPVFTLTFVSTTGQFQRQATFIDEDTIDLCVISSAGTIGSCVILVHDDPTLH